jgi:hypothetical protein
MPEPKRNDPYSRPINATRPDAVVQGEFYGTLDTSKARNHAAGANDATPAGRFQSGVSVVPTWPKPIPKDNLGPEGKPVVTPADNAPTPPPTTPNTDTTSLSDDESITEDDLFG